VLAAAEAVHTPASMKAIAEWFPAEKRSLAVGIVNTASNIGAITAPLLVPFMAGNLGWHAAFLITGGLGFVWLAAWLVLSKASPIQAQASVDTSALAKASWREMFNYRATWAIALAKMFTDLVWWFLLFWAPGFLMDTYNLNMRQAGLPLAVIYSLAAIGAFSGGILPTWLLAKGRSLNFARKFSMLLYALLIVPLPLAIGLSNPWTAVVVIGVALFAHQGFSTNIFSMAVDQFPSQKVATVISIGALFGNLSGMVMLEFAGYVLQTYKTYMPMFVICSSVYLIALLVIHLLIPKLEVRAA
jgi:MFS transporter, ACS family, hexuronate transporter